MKYTICDAPDFGAVRFQFEAPGETLIAESGAMVAMSPQVELATQLRGGILAAAKRKMLGGESLFQNSYRATSKGQEVVLAPAPEGDLRAMELQTGQEFFLQSGAYLGHFGEQLTLDTRWSGVKAFFGGLGFFMLRVEGPGTLFYSAYGAIHEVEVSDMYTCDTGHIVGFSAGLDYNIGKFGGYKGLFLSGEGLVCKFRGQGKLLLQTRNPASLAGFLHPYRRVNSN